MNAPAEQTLWTVYQPKSPKEYQHIWAKTPAEARTQCCLPGRKRSLTIVRTLCEYENHDCHYDYQHDRAVAFVNHVPMCPECIAVAARPIGERFEDIERRLAELADDLNAHLEDHD